MENKIKSNLGIVKIMSCCVRVHALEECGYESRIYSGPPSSLLESISSDLNATLFSPAAAHRVSQVSLPCVPTIRIARLFIHIEGGNSGAAQLIIPNAAV